MLQSSLADAIEKLQEAQQDAQEAADRYRRAQAEFERVSHLAAKAAAAIDLIRNVVVELLDHVPGFQAQAVKMAIDTYLTLAQRLLDAIDNLLSLTPKDLQRDQHGKIDPSNPTGDAAVGANRNISDTELKALIDAHNALVDARREVEQARDAINTIRRQIDDNERAARDQAAADQARTHRIADLERHIAGLESEIATLEGELDVARGRLAEAEGALAADGVARIDAAIRDSVALLEGELESFVAADRLPPIHPSIAEKMPADVRKAHACIARWYAYFAGEPRPDADPALDPKLQRLTTLWGRLFGRFQQQLTQIDLLERLDPESKRLAARRAELARIRELMRAIEQILCCCHDEQADHRGPGDDEQALRRLQQVEQRLAAGRGDGRAEQALVRQLVRVAAAKPLDAGGVLQARKALFSAVQDARYGR